MQFPTIFQYIESLINNQGLFHTLREVECVMRHDGTPDFRVGNFGVVFKVRVAGEVMALKLFTRHAPGRIESYRKVSDFMSTLGPEKMDHLARHSLLDNELYVFSPEDTTGQFYPLILMEWVEGESMASHIREAVMDRDMEQIHALSEQFNELSLWLLDQHFAHGDLKPENIVMRNSDNKMILIDYDAMYVPRMAGEIAVEIGTPPYQHPSRGKFPLSKHIDDYSIAIIALSLKALEADPRLWIEFHDGENMILNGAQIISGSDNCYNKLKGMPAIRDSALYGLLTRPTIVLDGLRSALIELQEAQKPSTDNQDIAPTNTINLPPYKQLIPHKVNGQCGYLGERGDWEIQPRFLSALDFREGLAAVRDTTGWGFIDQSGRYRIPPIYTSVSSFSEGLSAVALTNKFGYINTFGQMVIATKYDNATHIKEGLGLVRRGDKYGFISAQDKRMAISAKFDYAQSFSDSVAVAMVNKKYGYIDLQGKWVIKPQFDYAQNCHQGKAYVEINGQSKEITVHHRMQNKDNEPTSPESHIANLLEVQ